MNAASEETLKQLLQVSKDSSGYIRALAEKLGANISGLAGSADDSADALDGLGGVAGKVVSAFGSIITGLNSFGRTAADSGVSVSSSYMKLSGYLEKGPLQTAMQKIAVLSQEFENNKKIYNDLARNGATFGGSLANVAVVSGRAYMTMSQFAEVAKKSTDVFRLLGPTTESGMNKFVDIQNKLLDEKSPYARNIIALTGDAEGAAEALTGYMRSQASMNKQEFMSTERIIQGTIDYAREMDTLSKITGKRKDQIQKEYDEVAAEESFQEYLSTLDADKADAARAAINTARQTFGKDVADQLRTAIQTGISTPLTEGQQNMYLMTGGATQAFVEQTMISVNEGKKVAQIQRDVFDSARETYKFYKDFAGQNNTVLGINAAFGTGLQAKTAGVLAQMGRMNNAQESFEKMIQEQEKQRTGTATKLTEAELALTKLGATVNEARAKLLEPAFEKISEVSSKITQIGTDILNSNIVQNTINFLGDSLQFVLDAPEMITSAITDMFTKISSSETVQEIKEKFNEVYDTVAPHIAPHVIASMKSITNVITELIEKIPGVTSLEDKIKTKESEVSVTENKLRSTSVEKEPLRYKELSDELKKSQNDLTLLKKDREYRGMNYFQIVEKVKQEMTMPVTPSVSPVPVPTGTNTGENGANQPPSSAASSPTTANYPETNAGPTTVSQVSPEQVTQLITSNKELGEILNNKLSELIMVARTTNENSSRTVTAINRLNNDGFTMAVA